MTKKTHRNDPCPCGSGKKYKQCCGHPKHVTLEVQSARMGGSSKIVNSKK